MAEMTVDQALALAIEKIQLGRVDEAEGVCHAILRSAPREAEAHRLLGMLACVTGKPEQAEAHVRDALECRPDSAEAYAALGLVYASQGRYEETERAARRALAGGVEGAGALSPVTAFGLDPLQAGVAQAGIAVRPAA